MPRTRRLPGFLNLFGALLVMALVLTVALRAQTTQPPSIAEFAPQPQHAIKEAPPELTSRFGSGSGGSAGLPAQPSPSPSPATLPPGARLNQCVGDPPRQTEDPQSPPCVAFWKGHNGGRTYRGVGDSTIRIAMAYCGTAKQSQATAGGFDMAFKNFFNARYEFYDRQIVPDCNSNFPGAFTGDAPTSRGDANAVAEADDFGSLYDNSAEGSPYYYDQLARDGLVVAGVAHSWATESWLAQRDPHVTQYEMANDRMFASLGEWACKWLAGRTAAHMGVAPLTGAPKRKFGLFFTTGNSYVPASTKPLTDQLSACGAGVGGDDVENTTNNADSGAITKFNADHVTTVLCLGGADSECSGLMRDAAQQNYFPEWVLTSYGISDRNWIYKLFKPPESELAGMFGLTFTPRQIKPLDEPWWWAVHEGDPSVPQTGTDEVGWQNLMEYHSFLQIAAGIQMAGPDLTPTTFMRGLQRAMFPNPYHPNMEGDVDFLGGSHTMTVDAAVWWWSNTARSPYSDEQAGTICYVDGGKRTRTGQWTQLPPNRDPLFGPACDSGG